jgi:hypothetical protein
MIGANDLFIAAHARSLGLTLVTYNALHILALFEKWASTYPHASNLIPTFRERVAPEATALPAAPGPDRFDEISL